MLVVSINVFAQNSNDVSNTETAEAMLSACRPIAKAPISGQTVDVPDTADSGVCWGAFTVIQHQIRLVVKGSHLFLFNVCAPANSIRTQLIAAFVEYITHNPQRYSDDSVDVIFDALRDSFPCVEKAKQK